MGLTQPEIRKKFRTKIIQTILILVFVSLCVGIGNIVNYQVNQEVAYEAVNQLNDSDAAYQNIRIIKNIQGLGKPYYLLVAIISFLFLWKIWFRFTKYLINRDDSVFY